MNVALKLHGYIAQLYMKSANVKERQGTSNAVLFTQS